MLMPRHISVGAFIFVLRHPINPIYIFWVISMSDTTDTTTIPAKDEDIEYMRIGNTAYKVTSFYNGDITYLDLIKNALKREADTLLRQMDNA